jgi:hypothetical protein
LPRRSDRPSALGNNELTTISVFERASRSVVSIVNGAGRLIGDLVTIEVEREGTPRTVTLILQSID